MDNPVTVGLVMYVIGKVIGFLFGMLYKQRQTAQPYTEAEIQKMEELEQAQLQTAYEIGKQEAQTEQRWIPCSERLPNCNGCYLVWRPHFWGGEIGMPAICYFDGQNTWHDSYGVDFERTLNPNDVTAWMPLPEPYKGEES